MIGRAYSDSNLYPIGSKFAIKYNMQPSDWPVYRDLVMTSPYNDVIIHKLQYAITWLVKHTGGEGGGRQAVMERSRKKKIKIKKIKIKSK